MFQVSLKRKSTISGYFLKKRIISVLLFFTLFTLCLSQLFINLKKYKDYLHVTDVPIHVCLEAKFE